MQRLQLHFLLCIRIRSWWSWYAVGGKLGRQSHYSPAHLRQYTSAQTDHRQGSFRLFSPCTHLKQTYLKFSKSVSMTSCKVLSPRFQQMRHPSQLVTLTFFEFDGANGLRVSNTWFKRKDSRESGHLHLRQPLNPAREILYHKSFTSVGLQRRKSHPELKVCPTISPGSGQLHLSQYACEEIQILPSSESSKSQAKYC